MWSLKTENTCPVMEPVSDRARIWMQVSRAPLHCFTCSRISSRLSLTSWGRPYLGPHWALRHPSPVPPHGCICPYPLFARSLFKRRGRASPHCYCVWHIVCMIDSTNRGKPSFPWQCLRNWFYIDPNTESARWMKSIISKWQIQISRVLGSQWWPPVFILCQSQCWAFTEGLGHQAISLHPASITDSRLISILKAGEN